jgi:hypothetical protein
MERRRQFKAANSVWRKTNASGDTLALVLNDFGVLYKFMGRFALADLTLRKSVRPRDSIALVADEASLAVSWLIQDARLEPSGSIADSSGVTTARLLSFHATKTIRGSKKWAACGRIWARCMPRGATRCG